MPNARRKDKKVVSIVLTDEMRAELEAYMKRWQCSRNEAINRILAEKLGVQLTERP